jgi:beta-glucosidase/6-phospho-beta-glucosidase/beta-galactosidase
MVRAAREAGVQVIWDLCHYGWPEDIDLFKPEFVRRFAAFARSFARILANESDETPFFAPINEISFWAWAGGTCGFFNPFARGRGDELKAQLVRASIEAMEAIWSVTPGARFAHIDPMINVVADPTRPASQRDAVRAHQAQYEAWDMLSGRKNPHLGGHPRYLDLVGVNYYYNNQWMVGGQQITDRGHPQYRPVRHLLREVYERYRRPLFIAETGIEFDERPSWLRYIGNETRRAMAAGVPIEGICLYPIVNYPGWDDGRHCQNGLWDYVDERGEREVYEPLARELLRQQDLMDDVLNAAA